jgi:[ribosomal protein S5]-alanine N-acetyltransferase
MGILKSENLTLRPLAIYDALSVARLLGPDPEGLRMTASIPEPCTEDAARRWIALKTSSSTGYAFAVTRSEDGEFLGVISYGGPPEEITIGYWIGKPFRRNGYATEAIRTVLRQAAGLGVRRLFAETFLDNPASSRVLVKNGFRWSGKGIRNFPLRGGICDVLHYVIELDG